MSERSTENENEDCAGSGNETGERRPWSPGPSSGGEICDCSMSELDLNEAKLIQIRFMLAIVIIFLRKVLPIGVFLLQYVQEVFTQLYSNSQYIMGQVFLDRQYVCVKFDRFCLLMI